jgi:hypothetical protein
MAQDMSYEAILAPLDGFAAAVAQFRERGGKGINVTLPFVAARWTIRRGPRPAEARPIRRSPPTS